MPELKIKISAEDQASPKISGLARTIDGMASVGGALVKTIGVGLAAGFGALTAGVVESVKAAADAQAVFAQTKAVIASTGMAAGLTADEVAAMASELQKVTRYSDDTILAGQNMLLTFTNIGKDVFPTATETMLDMAQAMGMDMKSAAVMLGKALQDPIAGATALRRVGVNLTEEQMKQIKAFMAVNDLASAQKVILNELAVEFGGSARAAGETFVGQLDRLKNAFDDIKEEIGMAILPSLQRLANMLIDELSKPEVIAFVNQLGAAVAGFAVSVIENIPRVVAVIRDLIAWFERNQEVVIGVLAAVGAAITAWVYTTVIPAVVTMLTTMGPIILVLAAIGAAAALLYRAWQTNFLGIRDTLTNVWNNTLKPTFDQLKLWLQTNLPIAVQTLTDFWNTKLLPALQAVWSFIQANVLPLLRALGELISAALTVAVTALAGAWQNVLLPALRAAYEWISSKLQPVIQSVSNFIANNWRPAIDGIAAAFGRVTDAIRKAADALRNIKLPAWLTPGSPTPFEIGLRGIAAAYRDVDATVRTSALAPQTINNYYNLSVQSLRSSEQIASDFVLMGVR